MVDAPDRPLAGLVIIEAASFVAAPSAGVALAQAGAEVIRVDPPGGGSDAHRWPVNSAGDSLFWAGLNKGKKSVTIDYRSAEGKELLIALATAPGPGRGIFVDNMVGKRRVRFQELQARRADAIQVSIQGKHNGAPAVDYTVNAEVGVPQMTGPRDVDAPVNHVVPAWDLLTGMTAAMAVLAAVHRRATTGIGSQVSIALADVALSGVGVMGWLAEAEQQGHARARHGNHVFGSFGVDFETSDRRRVMVVALTEGQWRALREVTETGAVFGALEEVLGANLDLESDRYRLQETIAAVLRPWFAQRDFATVSELLGRAQVLWSPYVDMYGAAANARKDPESVAVEIEQPGIGAMLATGSPVRWSGVAAAPVPAPIMGQDTEAVLTEVLGLSSVEVGRLRQSGVVSSGGLGE